MSKTLADFRTRLDILLKDAAANLVQGDKDAAIAQAAVLYSNDRPLELVADISGADSFDLALPAGWVDGFSRAQLIEYPYDSSVAVPTVLEDDEWFIYQTPTGKVLRLSSAVPAVGETLRLHFTTQHHIPTLPPVSIAASPTGAVRATNIVTITTSTAHGKVAGDLVRISGVTDTSFNGRFLVASAPLTTTLTYAQGGTNATSGGGLVTFDDTVPDSDFDAVCNLSAALAFEQLAALKVQSGDSTVGADAVDYRSKSSEYRAEATRHMKLYAQAIGVPGERPVAAGSATGNLDVDLSTGQDRLTHPRSSQ